MSPPMIGRMKNDALEARVAGAPDVDEIVSDATATIVGLNPGLLHSDLNLHAVVRHAVLRALEAHGLDITRLHRPTELWTNIGCAVGAIAVNVDAPLRPR